MPSSSRRNTGKLPSGVQTDETQTRLQVADSGIGIKPEFLPYVFDRFRQADGSTTRKHSGLGLGLSIVRHLVELHGGTAEVNSEGEGQGTTFTIHLPLHDEEALGRVDAKTSQDRVGQLLVIEKQRPAIQNNLAGLRILLLDDEADTLEVLSAVLVQHGAVVKATSTAPEALQSSTLWKPDIILCDIAMPEEDGYSFLQKLRALPADAGGNAPVIALTAFTDETEQMKILSSGFQMHLAKPVEPTVLVSALQEFVPKS
jgi:CheY-like chemotaxis protein